MAATLIKSGDDFYKLKGISDSLFDKYDIEESIEYKPSILLDESMAFKLSQFSTKEYCIDILKRSFNETDYNEYLNTLDKEYLLNIVDDVYYFQRITPSMIRPKMLLRITDSISKSSASFEKTAQGEVISLNSTPDAIYYKEKDILFFLKFTNIQRFFPGIEILYREATDDEVDAFLSQDFIKTNKEFSVKKVKKNNRKKIALLSNKYNNYSDEEKSKLKLYISKYVTNINFDGTAFEINSNKDLTSLLCGLDEDFYTKPIENQPYVANSSIKIRR
ncbi:MAG: hypothetical protein J6584_03050 [Lactobacillus sp.]|uniref:hypothetical protein n=1 Tax=Bombilactobacillus bombi TaxID=1303590 RepID=UPI0035E8C227|nr:hypothetical protein [Lactobacillus sp.]